MGIIITVFIAILVWWLLVAATGSGILGIVGALIVLLSGFPAGSYRGRS